MPTKQNRYRKIDGFAALIDAWCVATHNEPTYQVSDDIGNIEVYDMAALRRLR